MTVEGLIEALRKMPKEAEVVIPCGIVDPREASVRRVSIVRTGWLREDPRNGPGGLAVCNERGTERCVLIREAE